MKQVSVVMVEDEFIIAKDIATHLEYLGYEIAGVFESGEEAITFFKTRSADILLLDIHIKGPLDGIETAEIISGYTDIPIIYITAFSDSTTRERAIKTGPHAFIIKPFNFDNLNSAIELALYNYSNKRKAVPERTGKITLPETDGFTGNGVLFIKSNKRFEKLSKEKILYVEAQGSYCVVVTNERNYTLAQNLQHFIERLNHKNFIRIHRSYVVNLAHIHTIEENEVLLDGKSLPISRQYRQRFMENIKSL